MNLSETIPLYLTISRIYSYGNDSYKSCHLTYINVKIFDASDEALWRQWRFLTFIDVFYVTWQFQFLKKFRKIFLPFFVDFMTFFVLVVNFRQKDYLTSIDCTKIEEKLLVNRKFYLTQKSPLKKEKRVISAKC